jgi:hypothetical protein
VTEWLPQILSGFGWILYGSFFEWYWHKYWMHQPRFPREAFRGHTIVHHGLYRGDESFYLDDGDHPEHILLKPYALPGIVLAHLPLIWAIDRYLAPHTAIGALVAMVAYFVIYEYMHWNMHVPRGRFVERFRWFQFLRTHHKLHHRYYQKNFCVLFPLADWMLGTLITEERLARRRAEREAAIASGQPVADLKSKRRPERAGKEARPRRLSSRSPLAGEGRRPYRLPKVRELLHLGSNRRER